MPIHNDDSASELARNLGLVDRGMRAPAVIHKIGASIGSAMANRDEESLQLLKKFVDLAEELTLHGPDGKAIRTVLTSVVQGYLDHVEGTQISQHKIQENLQTWRPMIGEWQPVMDVLQSSGPIAPRDVADRLGVTIGETKNRIAQLSQEGLVEPWPRPSTSDQTVAFSGPLTISYVLTNMGQALAKHLKQETSAQASRPTGEQRSASGHLRAVVG
ncbi:MAG: hypothetical protein WDO70_12120 [Alphaproteobacteria bacterium]